MKNVYKIVLLLVLVLGIVIFAGCGNQAGDKAARDSGLNGLTNEKPDLPGQLSRWHYQ